MVGFGVWLVAVVADPADDDVMDIILPVGAFFFPASK